MSFATRPWNYPFCCRLLHLCFWVRA